MPEAKQLFVISFAQRTTSGPAEEVIPLSENGGAATPSIPVPPGTTLVISDIDVAAGGSIGIFRLQQDNGSGFFTIGGFVVTGTGLATWLTVSPNVGWLIDGNAGPAVAMRVTATTPVGALPIACVMTGYRES